MEYDILAFPKLNTWLQASIDRPAARKARLLRE
ncbi:hypothetical protein FHW64_002393 [Variovorax sp. Sphag1AA]|nr:hypothetical protein [Variovorax sp. Sphag1AA]